MSDTSDDSAVFETHRAGLTALAYRMLGDLSRAEDAVQEAWLRWEKRSVAVDSPRSFLLTTVARLCLDELGSARARHEETRGDRLPEPVDLRDSGIDQVERLDAISMAFLVMLQRLTPAERAVLLLHDVLDMSHGEIGELLGKTDASCRQLLGRARENVAAEKRIQRASRDDHRRLLHAFVRAVNVPGAHAELAILLAEDAVLTADGGATGVSFGKLRNVTRPVEGRARIMTLLQAFASQEAASSLSVEERLLNDEPAIVAFQGEHAIAAILVAIDAGQIARVFLHLDPARLRRFHRTR